MRVLAGNQHELLADGAASGLLFGTESTGYLTLTHPSKEPGDTGGAGDSPRNREDGVRFGEDYHGSASVGFEVGVLTDRDPTDPRGANADALDLFESTWTHPRWRTGLDAYAVLRSNMVGSRTRRCYGRPRRFAATEDGLAKKGYSTFLCDFTVADGLWYDDAASTATTVDSATGGGQRQTSITVGGTRDAWPVVTITPGSSRLTSPTVVLGPLRVSLPGVILDPGQSLAWDSQPWSRQFILNNDRTISVGNVVPSGSSTLLADFHLTQGVHLLTLTADQLPANARATVSWRNAWSRW